MPPPSSGVNIECYFWSSGAGVQLYFTFSWRCSERQLWAEKLARSPKAALQQNLGRKRGVSTNERRKFKRKGDVSPSRFSFSQFSAAFHMHPCRSRSWCKQPPSPCPSGVTSDLWTPEFLPQESKGCCRYTPSVQQGEHFQSHRVSLAGAGEETGCRPGQPRSVIGILWPSDEMPDTVCLHTAPADQVEFVSPNTNIYLCVTRSASSAVAQKPGKYKPGFHLEHSDTAGSKRVAAWTMLR